MSCSSACLLIFHRVIHSICTLPMSILRKLRSTTGIDPSTGCVIFANPQTLRAPWHPSLEVTQKPHVVNESVSHKAVFNHVAAAFFPPLFLLSLTRVMFVGLFTTIFFFGCYGIFSFNRLPSALLPCYTTSSSYQLHYLNSIM